MSSTTILARYRKETKKRLVLSGTNQHALQTLFGDDVTACFGKRVPLEPTPMHVAGRELVVIRLKPALGGNAAGPKAPASEKVRDDGPAANNGAERHPGAMASS